MFTIVLLLFFLDRQIPSHPVNFEYSVKFTVINAGFEVEGTMKIKDALIRFDPDKFLDGKIQVSADPSSIETGIGIRDKHLKRSDYLDATTYPEIQLRSKDFSKTGKNEFTGKFDLTIKSITKEIIIPFTIKRKNDATFYQGDFTINRLDFKIGEESLTLDETVHIQVGARREF